MLPISMLVVDITAEQLLKDYDRVLLCCGASHPRDIKVPGRDAKGIYFAVDFLKQVTKSLLDIDFAKFPDMSLQGQKCSGHRRWRYR